jgi:hypothetical protein
MTATLTIPVTFAVPAQSTTTNRSLAMRQRCAGHAQEVSTQMEQKPQWLASAIRGSNSFRLEIKDPIATHASPDISRR